MAYYMFPLLFEVDRFSWIWTANYKSPNKEINYKAQIEGLVLRGYFQDRE